jgi:hypothetical protein
MASWACSMLNSFTQDASIGWYPFHLTKYSRSHPLSCLDLSTPLSPPLVLEARSGIKFQLLPLFHIVGPFLGLTKNLGAHHLVSELQLSSIHFLGGLNGTQEKL